MYLSVLYTLLVYTVVPLPVVCQVYRGEEFPCRILVLPINGIKLLSVNREDSAIPDAIPVIRLLRPVV